MVGSPACPASAIKARAMANPIQKNRLFFGKASFLRFIFRVSFGVVLGDIFLSMKVYVEEDERSLASLGDDKNI